MIQLTLRRDIAPHEVLSVVQGCLRIFTTSLAKNDGEISPWQNASTRGIGYIVSAVVDAVRMTEDTRQAVCELLHSTWFELQANLATRLDVDGKKGNVGKEEGERD